MKNGMDEFMSEENVAGTLDALNKKQEYIERDYKFDTSKYVVIKSRVRRDIKTGRLICDAEM